MVYEDYTGILLPYSLLRTSKLRNLDRGFGFTVYGCCVGFGSRLLS